MNTEETPTLDDVLRDLSYPAEKWQITTCAEIYGADLRTRRQLYGLAARSYADANDIAKALNQ